MKKTRKCKNPDADRQINALLTNIENMARNGDTRYDAPLVNFCLDRLKERHGQSKRYIMCKLIESGLASHPDYAAEFEVLKSQYERLAGRTGGESGPGEASFETI